MRKPPFESFRAALLGAAASIVLSLFPACAPLPPPVAPEAPPRVELPPPAPEEAPPRLPLELDPQRFAKIDRAAQEEIAAGHVPGAVILVGHRGKIVHRRAYGQRAVQPRTQAMTPDTIFDLASLTKVVATATAVMQLAEQGRLDLDRPVAAYWPEFGKNGKSRITLRQLLTHTSGLRAEVSSRTPWVGYDGALAAIAADRPVTPPGAGFRYSDANFIVLGELVRRVSSLPLERYCAQNIFRPLALRDTMFLPPAGRQARIAPTDIQGDRLRWGEVSDPTAHRMGGVAGHAGLFSSADDLAVFAQMLINRGAWGNKHILSQKSVAALTKPVTLPGGSIRRGLGWDILSPYSKDHAASFPAGSFGHTGYTGTSIWIDAKSQTFLIILTSRLHPNGKGQVKALRAKTAAAVAAAISMGPPARTVWGDAGLEATALGAGQSDGPRRVRPGIEVLAAQKFAPLAGKNIGVITNHTALDGAGRSTLKILLKAPGVKVRAIFSPEHGLEGTLDEKVSSGQDQATGLPVYSLYGKVKRPTPDMLKGLDALVYDIQDVGARYYTYITTMAYAMEAAAAQGLEFFVLDRPNPINAAIVQGPMLDRSLKSFTGYFPLPVRYGMTAGELAKLFNRENQLGTRLHVVRMEGYRRDMWFDETGLRWVNPSPNIRSLDQAILYTAVGLLESANVSVGRGTAWPFEVLGAPYISGERLAQHLRQRHLSGVAFEPVNFVPAASRFRGQRCQGVRVRLTDRNALDGPALGIELMVALYRLHPGEFSLDPTLSMVGDPAVLKAIKNGRDPQDIRRGWQPQLEAFRRLRSAYLLY